MKVRCVRLINASGQAEDRSAWLTIGKTYLVLSIVQDVHRRWLLRLVGDELNGVALFPREQFEVLSSSIPPTWIVSWDGSGSFSLEPEPWTHSGFWERYYDRDSGAVEVFKQETKKIIDAEWLVEDQPGSLIRQ